MPNTKKRTPEDKIRTFPVNFEQSNPTNYLPINKSNNTYIYYVSQNEKDFVPKRYKSSR